MDKDTAWSLFEETGNIDAYMLYHDLIYGDEASLQQEGQLDADENRRPGYSGLERR